MDSMMRVIDAVSPDIEFIPCEAGEEGWKEPSGDALSPDGAWGVLTSIRSSTDISNSIMAYGS